MSKALKIADDEIEALLAMDITWEMKNTLSDYEREYLMEWFKDQKPSAACRRMTLSKAKDGMSAGVTAHLVHNRPHVRRIANAYIKQNLASHDITPDRIIEELRKIALVDLREFTKIKGNRLTISETDKIPEELSAAIKKITRKVGPNGVQLELELFDKIKALELLGRYHAMFKEVVDSNVNMKVGGVLRVPAPQTAEEWERGKGSEADGG
jgi:hypothetical protein